MELDEFLKTINQSKRRELVKFLHEHNREMQIERISEKNQSGRKDHGPLVLLVVSRNIYDGTRWDTWSLTDILEDTETLITWYIRAHDFLELVQHTGLVKKHAGGRPKRTLTESERKQIDKMRHEGLSINAIAVELRAGNRLIMEYCKNSINNL